MNETIYSEFEKRFRGPRELILNRLQVYLPFVMPLKQHFPQCSAVDLACGRGEWLETLRAIGINARGVDLDDGMLQSCRELDLAVSNEDAIAFLSGLPDSSENIISAFHFVEHISFENLQILIREAFRVLTPAGLLILETPNSENLIVGTSSFYLDPTHLRPLPSSLLSFLTEYYGFFNSKVLRLNEKREILTEADISLLKVLEGVSPDYSVIAQKSASDILVSLTKEAFNQEYGIKLSDLTEKYDQKTLDLGKRLLDLELSSRDAVRFMRESKILKAEFYLQKILRKLRSYIHKFLEKN